MEFVYFKVSLEVSWYLLQENKKYLVAKRMMVIVHTLMEWSRYSRKRLLSSCKMKDSCAMEITVEELPYSKLW